jgi:hypothetical protein
MQKKVRYFKTYLNPNIFSIFPSFKINTSSSFLKDIKFRTGGMAQAVEYLLCKHEALSSNTTKTKLKIKIESVARLMSFHNKILKIYNVSLYNTEVIPMHDVADLLGTGIRRQLLS